MARGIHGGGMCGGGHAWPWGCMAEGMHGRGCAWQEGAWQILRDMVNERVVHILLECILVYMLPGGEDCVLRRLAMDSSDSLLVQH